MDYFEVLIDGCAAVYQEVDGSGNFRYTNGDGVTVDPPIGDPVRYILRSWCVNRPAWMEPIAAV